MINPVFLRTFVKLVQTNHFTKTADALFMTQPGVTQHIKKLELYLGQSLLTRYGKKFELTYAGECLYQYGIEQAQAEFELVDLLSSDNKYQGECQLACSGALAMQLYPKLLELQQAHKQLSINVESAPNNVILERVRTNQSEIGLVTQYVDDPLLVFQQIGEDSLCLLLPSNSDASWLGLLELGFINHPDGYAYANALLALNFPDEFESIQQLPASGYINQIGQILLPVSRGLGFTVLQRSAFDAFADTVNIKIAELDFPIKEQVYLVYKKHRQLNKRYELVNQLIANHWVKES
jgi:DNA-binding transcriptional LysR family regulator